MNNKIFLCSILSVLSCCFIINSVFSQSYFKENQEVTAVSSEGVKSPEQFFGFEIGAKHLTAAEIFFYANYLSVNSNRIELVKHGRTHENNQLFHLLISTPKNIKGWEKLKNQRNELYKSQEEIKMDSLLVLYQGYSVHGDEPSGAHASILYAYYLANASQKENEKLKQCVIIVDPCMNPDGLTRYANWANSNQHQNTLGDPNDKEHMQDWPSGRTNHYLFDLNRDWLLAVHPESKARLSVFHSWKPHVLTDHHEMGTHASFFFQPGVPERVNPSTPANNQYLTKELAKFHEKALDKKAVNYFNEQQYDDYYYGKGSTYPDINGSIGILFEQGATEGQYITTENGDRTFKDAIENQLTTSLSTLNGSLALKDKLTKYQYEFYKESYQKSQSLSKEGWILSSKESNKLNVLSGFFEIHDIKSTRTSDELFIPFKQRNYRLIKSMLEIQTEFNDSAFYDVSAWTIPMAYNIEISEGSQPKEKYKKKVIASEENLPVVAYAIRKRGVIGFKMLSYLQSKNIIVRVITEKSKFVSKDGVTVVLESGDLIISNERQSISKNELLFTLSKLRKKTSVLELGSASGINSLDTGSPSFKAIEAKNILLLAGNGVSAYESGEIWHLFDVKLNVSITRISPKMINSIDLQKYNVLLLPDGNYKNISSDGVSKLKLWVEKGNTIIAQKRAVKWLSSNYFGSIKTAKFNYPPKLIAYNKLDALDGARSIGGAIVETTIVESHPLSFGVESKQVYFMKKGKLKLVEPLNPNAVVARYADSPLASGFISNENLHQFKNAPASVIYGVGNGRIIVFADNLNFRGYWYEGTKIYLNAVYFSTLVKYDAIE